MDIEMVLALYIMQNVKHPSESGINIRKVFNEYVGTI